MNRIFYLLFGIFLLLGNAEGQNKLQINGLMVVIDRTEIDANVSKRNVNDKQKYLINVPNNNDVELYIDDTKNDIKGKIEKLAIKIVNKSDINIIIYKTVFHKTVVIEYPGKEIVKIFNSEFTSAGWGDIIILGTDKENAYFSINSFNLVRNIIYKKPYYDFYKYNLENKTVSKFN